VTELKKCNEGCPVACDFCIHFDKYFDEDFEFTGEGKCLIKNEDVQFSGYCEDFHCFNVED
jgi:hypothetical protein